MDFFAQRLKKLPPYFFAELDCLKQSANQLGQLIDFSEGSPDYPPPRPIIQAMVKALQNPAYHRYPTYQGMLSARIAVANWYQRRFGVELDPEKEICMLLGAKEGIAHLIWAVAEKGDRIALPNPAFPMYYNQALLSGAEPVIMPLIEDNDFLPDLSIVRRKRVKLVCLNYPNNPTAAVAPLSFYQDLVNLAQKQGFCVYNDNVYSEIYFTAPPASILQVAGAKECCIEFHSLSKTFNMAGWRIGFAVGNANLISALLKIKQNVDSGPFSAIQATALYALNQTERLTEAIRARYKKRRDLLTDGLKRLGWAMPKPAATFFVWVKIKGNDSMAFAKKLLRQSQIMIAPGIGFGKYGEGYIRFALVVSENKIKQAIKRLGLWR